MKITRHADGVIRRFGGATFLIPVSGTTAGSSNAFEFNRVAEEIWLRLPLGKRLNSARSLMYSRSCSRRTDPPLRPT